MLEGDRLISHTMAGIRIAAVLCILCSVSSAAAQSVSGVRGLNGGVAPLFGLVGPGNLYIDNQGTQGFIYNFGNNFESYSFRNPTTGQAWSGANTFEWTPPAAGTYAVQVWVRNTGSVSAQDAWAGLSGLSVVP